MTAYPCTGIKICENIAVATHGPYISTFDHASGRALKSTVSSLLSPSSPASPANQFIVDVDLCLRERRLVSVDQQKSLKVWDLDTLGIISVRELPKRPNQVLVTKDGASILISDKFGDVFLYPMVAPEVKPIAQKPQPNTLEGRKSLVSHSSPSVGTLILGHASSLLMMLLTPDYRFIITADRDEHIRISHYPKGYNVERFCMGHTKYISALHLPPALPGTLISAGGDRQMFAWDYITGRRTGRLDIWTAVHSATKVSSQRRKFRRQEKGPGLGRRARKREERRLKEEQRRHAQEEQKRRKETSNVDPQGLPTNEDVEMDGGDDSDSSLRHDVPQEAGSTGAVERLPLEDGNKSERYIELPGGLTVGPARVELPALEEVIVVSQVESLEHASQHALVFSAVGADAVFFAPLALTTGLVFDGPIHRYDLPHPVLRIAVPIRAEGSETPANRVWVTLDHTFAAQDDADPDVNEQGPPSADAVETVTRASDASAESTNGIVCLQWKGGDTITPLAMDDEPMLRTLRALPPISATEKDLKELDLYGSLTSLPKTEEVDEPGGIGQEALPSGSIEQAADKSPAPEMEGVQQARVESRQVKKSGRKKWQDKIDSRKQQQQQQQRSQGTSSTTVAAKKDEVVDNESISNPNAIVSSSGVLQGGGDGQVGKDRGREDAHSLPPSSSSNTVIDSGDVVVVVRNSGAQTYDGIDLPEGPVPKRMKTARDEA